MSKDREKAEPETSPATSERRPALLFLRGELFAAPIPLERNEVTLGRALEADVRVNDAGASPRMQRILMKRGFASPTTKQDFCNHLRLTACKCSGENAGEVIARVVNCGWLRRLCRPRYASEALGEAVSAVSAIF